LILHFVNSIGQHTHITDMTKAHTYLCFINSMA